VQRRIGIAAGFLALLTGACGSTDDETATPDQVVAAICARLDQCKMTTRKATCQMSYTFGCQGAQSFDGRAAAACVHAMSAADCANATWWPGDELPDVCNKICH
jgi:hypothetical protein